MKLSSNLATMIFLSTFMTQAKASFIPDGACILETGRITCEKGYRRCQVNCSQSVKIKTKEGSVQVIQLLEFGYGEENDLGVINFCSGAKKNAKNALERQTELRSCGGFENLDYFSL